MFLTLDCTGVISTAPDNGAFPKCAALSAGTCGDQRPHLHRTSVIMSSCRPWRIVVIAAFAVGAVTAHGNGVSFPETKSYISRDLRWRVSCESKISPDGSGLHSLYASRLDGSGRRLVYESGRWCELLWNQSGDIVAVTDWEGSNVATVFVVDLNLPERKQDIGNIAPEISKKLGRDECEGHIYWEALKWESPDTITLRVFGHTDEAQGHAFCYTFRVNLRDRTVVQLAKDISDTAEDAAWNSKRSKR
jgi:hypothetical protein